MKILLDSEGKVNFDEITRGATVQEFLDAIDIFLKDNRLPCDQCGESCCKKSWAVEADNVFVNRICSWDQELTKKFVQEKLVLKENIFREFDQYVLKKESSCSYVTVANLCTIYDQRPIICRLYICSDKSHRYTTVRELIGAVYLEALVQEEEMRNHRLTQEIVNQYRRNPAVFAKDYNIPLEDIFNYAQDEGWIEQEALQELYQGL